MFPSSAQALSQQAIRQMLTQVSQLMEQGNMAAAEAMVAPFLAPGVPPDPYVLNAAGMVRLNQNRPAEALPLFSQAVRMEPREAAFRFSQGLAFAALAMTDDAEAAFRAVLKANPGHAAALYELGSLLHRVRRFEEAESAFRQLLRVMPGHAPAKLMLGSVLIDAGKPAEAELPLRRGLQEASEPRLKAFLHNNLGMALRRQRKDEESLAEYEEAVRLAPGHPQFALHRAEALQNLGRHDEALAIFEQELKRRPDDPGLHHSYNDLLYRLGRHEDYLKSYDRAPATRPLLLGKAFFLSHEKRGAEAHAVYAEMLKRDASDRVAALGVANTLTMMARYDEAGRAFDAILAREPANAELLSCAAEAVLQGGDAQKAADFCERGLQLEPYNGSCLALLSIASRMLEDERDEALNGYDTLVKAYELEPPDGFSSMDDFNAELDAALDRLHPRTREFVNQSLRGGTQTPDQIFDMSLPLVDKLRTRIDETVARYIADLKEDGKHPMLSRRRRDFRYAGSWSSRLKDCGFHVNHIHPMGWISSCYYIALPDAVKDRENRQGWIKFGEPSFPAALKNPVRRAIQPAPGRLVLFPSYMWHGTVPFRDRAPRTTIAFDVIPAG